MPRTKEISEDQRLRIVDLRKARKGNKSISKSHDVYQSTVRQIPHPVVTQQNTRGNNSL